MGSSEYEVTHGSVHFAGDDVTDWPVDERAKAGMFLAFQYPQEIAGVSVIEFLRQALSARKGFDLSVLELRLATMDWMKRLGMDSSFVDRSLNEGFSGGEKKRNEIMQMAILEPELAILDETDSGLDTMRSASMSRPESVSSRMARSGSRTAICMISLRFFSPPENPSLRYLSTNDESIPSRFIQSIVASRSSSTLRSMPLRADRACRRN